MKIIVMNKIYYRTLWLPVLLTIYVTASYVYLFVKGSIDHSAKSYLLIGLSYLCVGGIFYFRFKRIRQIKEMEEKLKDINNDKHSQQ